MWTGHVSDTERWAMLEIFRKMLQCHILYKLHTNNCKCCYATSVFHVFGACNTKKPCKSCEYFQRCHWIEIALAQNIQVAYKLWFVCIFFKCLKQIPLIVSSKVFQTTAIIESIIVFTGHFFSLFVKGLKKHIQKNTEENEHEQTIDFLLYQINQHPRSSEKSSTLLRTVASWQSCKVSTIVQHGSSTV